MRPSALIEAHMRLITTNYHRYTLLNNTNLTVTKSLRHEGSGRPIPDCLRHLALHIEGSVRRHSQGKAQRLEQNST